MELAEDGRKRLVSCGFDPSAARPQSFHSLHSGFVTEDASTGLPHRSPQNCGSLLKTVYTLPLTAVVMSRMISDSSGCSFFIFSTRLMELRTVEW